MKKLYILLPVLLLAACAQNPYEDEEYQDEVLLDEETGLNVQENMPAEQRKDKTDSYTGSQQGAKISADGTVIELPAQQIYIGGAPTPAGTFGGQPIAYSEPMSGEWGTRAGENRRPTPAAVVTLQNIAYPNTYAQCMAVDTACVASYEQQGYRRVSGLPRFAGYQDVLSGSDYPENGRWRNGNNIPRW